MNIEITAKRHVSYDDQYEISVKTTKQLSQEEYNSIMNAIKIITTVLDSHLDTLAKTKEE